MWTKVPSGKVPVLATRYSQLLSHSNATSGKGVALVTRIDTLHFGPHATVYVARSATQYKAVGDRVSRQSIEAVNKSRLQLIATDWKSTGKVSGFLDEALCKPQPLALKQVATTPLARTLGVNH